MLRDVNSVSQIMKKNVVSLDASSTVKNAIRVMTEECVGCLVVTNGLKPVGIITERDIMRCILQDKEVLEHGIDKVMSQPLLVVDPDTAVVEALDLMKAKEIRHLPVVADDQLCGIITMHSDLLYWALGTITRGTSTS